MQRGARVRKTKMQNWQTTISGIAALAGAIVLISMGRTAEGIALIPVAIGLWRAKDAK